MVWDPNAKRSGTTQHKRWAEQVKRRDSYRCQDCGYQGTPGCADVEADHITPVSREGAYDLDNGVTLCVSCHKAKTQSEAAAGKARHSRRRPTAPHPGLITS